MFRKIRQEPNDSIIDTSITLKVDYRDNIKEINQLLQNHYSELYQFEAEELSHFAKITNPNDEEDANNYLVMDLVSAVFKRQNFSEINQTAKNLILNLPTPFAILNCQAQYSFIQFLSDSTVVFKINFINKNIDGERIKNFTDFINDTNEEIIYSDNPNDLYEDYITFDFETNFVNSFLGKFFDEDLEIICSDIERFQNFYELLFRLKSEVLRQKLIENNQSDEKNNIEEINSEIDKLMNSYQDFQAACKRDLEFRDAYYLNKKADLRNFKERNISDWDLDEQKK